MSPAPHLPPASDSVPSALAPALPAVLRWRQILLLTLGAVALYLALRTLPTGTNLHSADFNMAGKGMVELCDPANPQFVAVTTARSPVTMTLRAESAVVGPGQPLRMTLGLATSTGKPVGPVDLMVQHTRKLHLLLIDPTLRDYQHVHPEPGVVAGEWTFTFTPRLPGGYRFFADFVPLPTARSLYASADLTIEGQATSPGPAPFSWDAAVEGYQFKLTPDAPVRAGRPVTLTFEVARTDGGVVAMEPVMDAYAHLVAFDQERSGFAHLHPLTGEPNAPITPLDPIRPRLPFKITIPSAGVYVIWAQVKLGGRELFAPFWFEVAP